MDTLTPERRSENMRRIRSTDTGIEMMVRRFAHSLGYRYRLHAHDLPGKPDMVFSRLGKIIQVYGCYWHPHPRCPISHVPKSREDYWIPKLKNNLERDRLNLRLLRKLGWSVLLLRECEFRNGTWQTRVTGFLAR